MTQPLTLLQEFTNTNKEIIEKGDKVFFNDVSFDRSQPIKFVGKNGKTFQYPLRLILFLLKNKNLPHNDYVRLAIEKRVGHVGLPRRQEVLQSILNDTLENQAEQPQSNR